MLRLDLLFEVLVRGDEDAHVRLDRLGAADPARTPEIE